MMQPMIFIGHLLLKEDGVCIGCDREQGAICGETRGGQHYLFN